MLRVEAVSKSFGGVQALLDIDFHVEPKERVGLIGPNGSGKTTLINIIAGAFRPDSGRISFEGTDITKLPPHERSRIGISRTFQLPRPFFSMDVISNIMIPIEYSKAKATYTDPSTSEGVHSAQGIELAHHILNELGLLGKANQKPRELSLIELRKMELARALATKPKLLLLDEVMAGLTREEIDELILLLKQLNEDGIAIVMVEHIMRAVMNFSERVVVLSMGKLISVGSPSEISRDQNVVRVYLGE